MNGRMMMALLAIVLVVLCLGGCSGTAGDIVGVLTGINADVGIVSSQMALDGWTGFPTNAVELVDYSRDLAAAVAYARAHPEDAEPMQDCRHAFGAVGPHE